MPLTTQVSATTAIDLTGSPTVGGAIPSLSKGRTADIVLADGSGSNQANKCFLSNRTLASAANDDLDLATGLLDPFGASLIFATVKVIVIRADSSNTTNLTVSPGASNGFVGPFGASSHTVQVRPGGALVFVAPQTGWTVTPATGDILRVANGSGASATYTIEIAGT